MKKYSGLLFVFLVISALAFPGCGSGDSGGGGAEFDPALYYTKSEVDNLLQTIITYADPDDYSQDSITANDWAGRTSTGWTAPNGVRGALMEVTIVNGDSGSDPITTYIEVCSSDQTSAYMGTSMTIAADGVYYSKIFYVPVAGGTTVVAYHPYSAGHSGITDLGERDNFEIDIRPVAWFK